MRLALINYEYPPLGGGAGTATQALAREMSALGHQVAVVTTRFKGQPAREEDGGALILRVPAWRRREDCCTPPEMLSFMLSALARAPGLLRQLRPQVTLAFFGIPSGPVSWWVKQRLGAPYLVLLRGGDIPGFCPEQLAGYHRLTAPLIHWLWKRAALVVANSQGARDLALATGWGIPVAVLPNGVDTAFFHPPQGPRSQRPVTLLFVGRLSVQKGLPHLLQALAGLEGGSCPPWRLEIVGDGPLAPQLQRQALAPELAGRVTFHGWLPRARVAQVYRQADIFVLPSLDEGMPNVLLEAMASGLPSLVTQVPGSSELVRPEREGLLVPPADVAALGQACARLLADAPLRQRLGAAARQAAQARSWGQVARDLESMLREVLAAKVS